MKNILKTTFWKHKDLIAYCDSIGVNISQKTISSILDGTRGRFQEGKVIGFAENQIKKIEKAILDYKNSKDGEI